MEDLEGIVQNNVSNFCKILPSFVETWKRLVDDAIKPTRALSNYAEQLRHVERAKIKYIDDFEELQQNILFKIYSEIEAELHILKTILSELNQSNHNLKNKLSLLERSTIDLNWERESTLIKGTGTQPSLSRVLQEGFQFWRFFAGALKNINDNFRSLDVRDDRTVTKFSDSFKLDFQCVEVRTLLALTQYVNNEKFII